MFSKLIDMSSNVKITTVRCRLVTRAAFAITAIVGVAVAAGPGQALTILPTFESSFTGYSSSDTTFYEADVNNAIRAIENYIANPVTVKINFVGQTKGLGASGTHRSNLSYSSYVSDLKNNPNASIYQQTADATLPSVDPVPGNTSGQVSLTTPLIRAVENVTTIPTGPDGTIYLNLSIVNLDRTVTQNRKYYDLQAVAAHEIDEVLGIGGNGSDLSTNAKSNQTGSIGPLDLFRYSAPGIRSYTPTLGASSYFSINGGTTNQVNFNQNGSKGSDFGDWGPTKGQVHPQVQDAYGYPGIAGPNIGPSELIALNAAGWNLTQAGLNQIAVPVPSTWGLMAMIGAMGMLSLRRKSWSKPAQ